MTRGFDPPRPYSGKVSEMRPSKWAEVLGFGAPEVLHSLCYLGFLAARSGVVTAEELVRDGSALHELAHHLHGGPKTRGGKMAEIALGAMLALEAKTPGVPPPEVSILEIGVGPADVATDGPAPARFSVTPADVGRHVRRISTGEVDRVRKDPGNGWIHPGMYYEWQFAGAHDFEYVVVTPDAGR